MFLAHDQNTIRQHNGTTQGSWNQYINFHKLNVIKKAYPAEQMKYLSQYSSWGKKWIPSGGHSKPTTLQCRSLLFSHWPLFELNIWPSGQVRGIGWPLMQMKYWLHPAKLGNAVLFSTFLQILLLHVWLQKLFRVIFSLASAATVARITAITMATISDSEREWRIFLWIRSNYVDIKAKHMIYYYSFSISSVSKTLKMSDSCIFGSSNNSHSKCNFALFSFVAWIAIVVLWRRLQKHQFATSISLNERKEFLLFQNNKVSKLCDSVHKLLLRIGVTKNSDIWFCK